MAHTPTGVWLPALHSFVYSRPATVNFGVAVWCVWLGEAMESLRTNGYVHLLSLNLDFKQFGA